MLRFSVPSESDSILRITGVTVPFFRVQLPHVFPFLLACLFVAIVVVLSAIPVTESLVIPVCCKEPSLTRIIATTPQSGQSAGIVRDVKQVPHGSVFPKIVRR